MTRSHVLDSTLDEVRPSHVEGWVVQLRRKGLAGSTIRTIRFIQVSGLPRPPPLGTLRTALLHRLLHSLPALSSPPR